MDVGLIATWCERGEPPSSEEFYSALLRDDGRFDDAEGLFWDFKQVWPFSLSEEYFAGIARLICAFSNTYGGIIVFGVHDEKRDGGHNKVIINLDRFTKAITQLLGVTPSYTLKSYTNTEAGNVDVLFVRSRPKGTPPLRFLKNFEKYKAGTIWVRVGHEVIVAEAVHYPFLFCRASIEHDGERKALDGSIPPSPATLKQRFVGRTEVMDKLFRWLENSDEPRTYLHGRGGSGKTTIAYEFAKLLKGSGQDIRIFGEDNIDSVIFLSAKEKTLSVVDARVIDTGVADFSNEEELLRSILYYGGWTYDTEYLKESDIGVLRSDIKNFLDLNSIVIIIDDIDTLTTKGVDPGSDFLYRTLCRASKASRVLYTLRNSPSQSLVNAIEVPGLVGDDFEKFVKECVDHFNVPAPSDTFLKTKLIEVSERRPLVIEVIIALRRSCGDYDQAVALFQQQAGDTVRDYVFLREWEALRSNSPRLLLAALSEFNDPTSFDDLQSVLQFEPSLVKDCIGAVREMFLQIDEAGRNALYSLATLTRDFIKSRRTQLVGYRQLHERVKAYRRHVAVSNPRVANIVTQVERLLPARFPTHSSERVKDAQRIVCDKSLPAFVTEDPLYRIILGYVLSCSPQPSLREIRDAFDYAIKMRVEPEYKYLREWFNAERNSGLNDGRCIAIADFVLNGKRYSEQEKVEMIGRRATSLYARAQERFYTDPSEALEDLVESLKCHLRAYRLYYSSSDMRAENSIKYGKNTAFLLFGMLAKSQVAWEFFETIEALGKSGDGYLDPIELPVAESCEIVLRNTARQDSIARSRQRLKLAREAIAPERLWVSSQSRNRTLGHLQSLDYQLADKQQLLRQGTAQRNGAAG